MHKAYTGTESYLCRFLFIKLTDEVLRQMRGPRRTDVQGLRLLRLLDGEGVELG